MELLYTLNNGNNKDFNNKNFEKNNDIDNKVINNDTNNNITENKIEERKNFKKTFNVLIRNHEIILAYINNNKKKYKKNYNKNNIITDNYLVCKVKKLSAKNKNLKKIICLLKNIISTLKKENNKKNKNIIRPLNFLNEEKDVKYMSINEFNEKDLEIMELKNQLEQMKKINEEKIKKYTKKIHLFLFENYMLKKEINQKNEEFIQIENKLKLTERKVKETLTKIKNNNINHSNKFSLFFGNINKEKTPRTELTYREKKELILEKIGKKFKDKNNNLRTKDNNCINTSLNEIGSTIFTSLDTINDYKKLNKEKIEDLNKSIVNNNININEIRTDT